MNNFSERTKNVKIFVPQVIAPQRVTSVDKDFNNQVVIDFVHTS